MIRRCPTCAEDISVRAALCKYCGEPVPPELQAPVRPAPAKPDIVFVDERPYVRWEDAAIRGVFRRWWSTWAETIFHPARFWKRAPVEGGHLKPITFAWFQAAQMLMVALPFLILAGAACASCGEGRWAGLAALGGFYLMLYPLSFAVVALGAYATAILWHVPLKLLGGRGRFQATFRTVAYNSGADLLWLIPLAGAVLAPVMKTILNYQAFRAAHGMSSGRALFAALLPCLLGALVLVAIVVASAAGEMRLST